MATKLTRLTHKIAIQLHQVAKSCTICNSRFRRPVRKLLDTTLVSRFILVLWVQHHVEIGRTTYRNCSTMNCESHKFQIYSNFIIFCIIDKIYLSVSYLTTPCKLGMDHGSFEENPCYEYIRGCNQKFPDWPPGARTANGTALCH
jgi:hypothetical protein